MTRLYRELIMNNVVSKVEMLIRKSAKEVFNAFVDPSTIEKFWLKRASGPLAKDANVEWEFMVRGARETVAVTEFLPNQRTIPPASSRNALTRVRTQRYVPSEERSGNSISKGSPESSDSRQRCSTAGRTTGSMYDVQPQPSTSAGCEPV